MGSLEKTFEHLGELSDMINNLGEDAGKAHAKVDTIIRELASFEVDHADSQRNQANTVGDHNGSPIASLIGLAETLKPFLEAGKDMRDYFNALDHSKAKK